MDILLDMLVREGKKVESRETITTGQKGHARIMHLAS